MARRRRRLRVLQDADDGRFAVVVGGPDCFDDVCGDAHPRGAPGRHGVQPGHPPSSGGRVRARRDPTDLRRPSVVGHQLRRLGVAQHRSPTGHGRRNRRVPSGGAGDDRGTGRIVARPRTRPALGERTGAAVDGRRGTADPASRRADRRRRGAVQLSHGRRHRPGYALLGRGCVEGRPPGGRPGDLVDGQRGAGADRGRRDPRRAICACRYGEPRLSLHARWEGIAGCTAASRRGVEA
jgi:hypothetical protein